MLDKYRLHFINSQLLQSSIVYLSLSDLARCPFNWWLKHTKSSTLHCYRSSFHCFRFLRVGCWTQLRVQCSKKATLEDKMYGGKQKKNTTNCERGSEIGLRRNEIQSDRREFYCCWSLTSIVIMSCLVLFTFQFSSWNTKYSRELGKCRHDMKEMEKKKKRHSNVRFDRVRSKWFLSNSKFNAIRGMIDLWLSSRTVHGARCMQNLPLISRCIKLFFSDAWKFQRANEMGVNHGDFGD